MPWTPLDFGKYEGKTLPQILFADPDWFFWAWEQGIFGKKGPSWKAEAGDVYRKATHIRIKQLGPERLVAEYTSEASASKIGEVEIVPESQSLHQRSFRSDVLDMSVPRRFKGYDKRGGSIFIKRLKEILFGKKSARMTKSRCESFFDDPGNFDL